MAREPPDWLNKEFLAEALQKEEVRHEKVIVTKFTATPATAVGDNYTSHMFRIHLTFIEGSSDELQEMALILKAPITTGVVSETAETWVMYDVEPSVYSDILPKMYRKLKTHVGPKSYYSSVRGALLLQDLKADGFVVCDRFKQLDFAHCKLVYETLAKYHATSVALHHDDPELIENIGKERTFSTDGAFSGFLKPWLKSSLKSFVEVFKEMGGEKTVADFLQSKEDDIWDSMVKICKRQPNILNVLNHGDCWTNNMMFKHDSDQQVVDIKLIDFQIPRFNTPVLDIIYFLWTSANEDVRANQQIQVFEVYLHTLNKTLEEYGCTERLTLEQLEDEIKYATDFLIWTVSFVQLFIFCEPELALDMGKYTSEDFTSGVVEEKFRAIFNGKRYRAMVPGIIRDLQAWLTSRRIVANTSLLRN